MGPAQPPAYDQARQSAPGRPELCRAAGNSPPPAASAWDLSLASAHAKPGPLRHRAAGRFCLQPHASPRRAREGSCAPSGFVQAASRAWPQQAVPRLTAALAAARCRLCGSLARPGQSVTTAGASCRGSSKLRDPVSDFAVAAGVLGSAQSSARLGWRLARRRPHLAG